jgi:RNA polymerase sigma-70 factor (ECF subfamily)
MSTATQESIHTRQSLLCRLRDLNDQQSWRVFFDLYWRLLYNVARRAGLEDTDAQDVVQETVIAVARKMPGFRYDPRRGSFKQWLLRITQRRVADHLRKVYRVPATVELTPEVLELNPPAGLGAEPDGSAFENAWHQEWQQAMFEAAVAQVRQKANPKHFQVFDYCVLKGWPVGKVAATLGLNAAQVYLAKHRVAQAVKRTARQLSELHSRDEPMARQP